MDSCQYHVLTLQHNADQFIKLLLKRTNVKQITTMPPWGGLEPIISSNTASPGYLSSSQRQAGSVYNLSTRSEVSNHFSNKSHPEDLGSLSQRQKGLVPLPTTSFIFILLLGKLITSFWEQQTKLARRYSLLTYILKDVDKTTPLRQVAADDTVRTGSPRVLGNLLPQLWWGSKSVALCLDHLSSFKVAKVSIPWMGRFKERVSPQAKSINNKE